MKKKSARPVKEKFKPKKASNTFQRQAAHKAKIALAPQLPNEDMSMRQTQT